MTAEQHAALPIGLHWRSAIGTVGHDRFIGRGPADREEAGHRPAYPFVNFVSFADFVRQKLKSALMRTSLPVRIEFGWSHGPLGVKLWL